MAEDFSPFDIDVTTEEPALEDLRKSGTGEDRWGIRVAIGGSYSDWYGSSAGGAAITRSTGTVTIRNDDYRSVVSIAAADAVRAEGDSGRTPFTFTVFRTGSLDGNVTVPWAVAGSGSKRADQFNFVGSVMPTGMVLLAARRRTQTITVNVLSDRAAEFDEQFTVTLGNPLGGLDTLDTGTNSATGTVRNDDPGAPRPAAAPAQGRNFAGVMSAGGLATAQAIAAQAFATLVDIPGSSGTTTAKRIASGAAIRA
ncbi:MAG: hypothetical protein ACKOEM_22495 [Planctomycetia bacterium]